MESRSFLPGLVTGLAAGGLLGWVVGSTSLQVLESKRCAALARLEPPGSAAPALESLHAAAPRARLAQDPSSEQAAPSAAAPGQSRGARLVSWDPVAEYQRLVLDPDPRAARWAEVARGLETLGERELAIESWWQVVRRAPEEGEALGRLRRLREGELERRIELELRSYTGYFEERDALECLLAPAMIAAGRAGEALILFDLESLQEDSCRHPERVYLRQRTSYRWDVLEAADPNAMEVTLRALLDSDQYQTRLWAAQRLARTWTTSGRQGEIELWLQSPSLLGNALRDRLAAGATTSELGQASAAQVPSSDEGQASSPTGDESARPPSAREVFERGWREDELFDGEELASFVRGEPELGAALLGERLETYVADVVLDLEQRVERILIIAEALGRLHERRAAIAAYEALVELDPHSVPWDVLRDLRLGRAPRF